MTPTDATPLPRSRRRLLVGAVATGAALAGAAVAWRRFQPDEGAEAPGLWDLSFATPTGQTLAMASVRGRPLVVNFWATWCPPCVEELPLLDRFSRDHAPKGWQVVGLAIDQPSAVRKFLAATPVGFPVGLAGLEGTELGKSLGNSSGGLPFTVVFGADGRVRERRMGKLTPADLSRWASAT